MKAALAALGVDSLTIRPVRRSYAFERPGIPHGDQWVLKVTYPAAKPALPTDWSSASCAGLLGAQGSPLESLLLKRRIKGPGWLRVTCPVATTSPGQMVSWCRVEVAAEGHKAVGPLALPPALLAALPVPRLVVAALNLKTVVSPKTNVHEVATASLVYLSGVRQDSAMEAKEWKRQVRRLTLVRPLEGAAYPPGWQPFVAQANSGSAGQVVSSQGSERALLSCLLAKVADIDPDVVVGHNAVGFDLDVLLHRAAALKLGAVWHKLGRLKRKKPPHLGGGALGTNDKAVTAALAGRLICDTWLR